LNSLQEQILIWPFRICNYYLFLRLLSQDVGDVSAFPDKLDEFLGKVFLFKLKINDERFSKADPKYTVMRLSDNQNMIDQYNKNRGLNEV